MRTKFEKLAHPINQLVYIFAQKDRSSQEHPKYNKRLEKGPLKFLHGAGKK